MKKARTPGADWLLTPALVALAGLVLVGLFLILLEIWRPRACGSQDCNSAREWMIATATLLVLLAGVYQYSRAQLWKRAEFVASEMDKFFSLPRVRNVLSMIDWTRRRVNLFVDDDAVPKDWPLITRRMQCTALVPHVVTRFRTDEERMLASENADTDLGGFTPDEVGIRDSMDEFLDRLERFAGFVDSGLVTPHDLRPYLGYWIADIANDNCDALDAAWTCCFMAYVQYYEYEGVQKLFKAYEFDITVGGARFGALRDKAMLEKDKFDVDLHEVRTAVLEKWTIKPEVETQK